MIGLVGPLSNILKREVRCTVKNLTLPKERSGLCPQLLGSNLQALGMSCLVGALSLVRVELACQKI